MIEVKDFLVRLQYKNGVAAISDSIVAEIVRLINLSDTLLDDLHRYLADIVVQNPDPKEGGHFDNRNVFVNRPAPLGTSNLYVRGAASTFVATLAHELGHFKDPDYFNFISGIDVGRKENQAAFIAVAVSGEGKAQYNAYRVAKEIAVKSGGADFIDIVAFGESPQGLYTRFLGLEGQADRQVALLTADISKAKVSGTQQSSYIQLYGNGWAVRNGGPGLDLTTVTSLSVDWTKPQGAVITLDQPPGKESSADRFIVTNPADLFRPPAQGDARRIVVPEVYHGTAVKLKFGSSDVDPVLTTAPGKSSSITYNTPGDHGISIGQAQRAPIGIADRFPIEFDVTGADLGGKQVFEGFSQFTAGSGNDTITVADDLDTSTLQVVDGGGGNNTIHAGTGNKTVYYGGSYGTNALFGSERFDAATISRLIGGPSAQDLRDHANDPNLPSLGNPADSHVTIHPGRGPAILIGGPGTNTFLSDTPRFAPSEDYKSSTNIIWGGGGKSTYEVHGGYFAIYHMANPTDERVSHLDFKLFRDHNYVGSSWGGYTEARSRIEYPLFGDGGQGFTLVINPSPDDLIRAVGVTASGASFDRTDSIASLISYAEGEGFYHIPGPEQGNILYEFQYLSSGGLRPLTIDSAAGDGSPLSPSAAGAALMGGGDTTFALGAAAESVTIDNFTDGNPGGVGTVSFDATVAYADVTIAANAAGDVLLTNAATNTVTTVVSALSDPNYAINQVTFADGTAFTLAQIAALAATGAPRRTSIFGFTTHDTLDSNGFATQAQGKGGADQFIFKTGYGTLTIHELAGDANTLVFGPGIRPGDLHVEVLGSYGYLSGRHLVLTDGVAGDRVTLTDMLVDAKAGVQRATFADGTIWSRAQLLALLPTATTGADTLFGSGAAETLDALGAPAGTQDFVQGNGAADTFVFKPGYGHLELDEPDQQTSTGTLQLAAGIRPGDVAIDRDPSGALLLTLGTAGDRVQLDGMIDRGADRFTRRGVAQVTFATGEVWAAADLLGAIGIGVPARARSLLGGQTLALGAEIDTVHYSAGVGVGTIMTGTPGTIAFGTGVALSSLFVTKTSAGLAITDGRATDKVILDGTVDATQTAFAAQGATLLLGTTATAIGGGDDFFHDGSTARFVRGQDGAVTAWGVDGAGSITAGQALSVNGAALVLDDGARIVGSGQDFLGNGSRALFVRGAHAEFIVGTFDPSGTLLAAYAPTRQGVAMTIDAGSTILGAGEDYFRDGEKAVFVRAATGSVSVWAFDATGALGASQTLTAAGAPIVVAPTAIVTGGGQDFFGDGGRTLFLRGSDGGLAAWGFDAAGGRTASVTFTIAGAPVTVRAADTVVGAGQDLFGNGGRTVFLRSAEGALRAGGFDRTGAINAGVDLTAGGAPLVIDSGASVIGAGMDFFGVSGRTVIVRDGTGALHAGGFDATGALTARMDFLTQGAALRVDRSATVVGGGEDFFGNGERALFLRQATGALEVLSFGAGGTLDLRQAFTLPGGGSATLEPGVSVVAAGSQSIMVQDGTGARHLWAFDSAGVRLAVT